MKHQIIKKLEAFIHLNKADLHIHSNYSDGKPTIEEILNYVQNLTDLRAIAITDHDTIEGAVFARDLCLQRKYRFDLIVGEEITCREGHILGLYLHSKIEPNQRAAAVIDQIHEQGGIAIAAHPFYHTRVKNPNMITMDGIGYRSLIKLHDKIDGVEIVNATPTLSDQNIAASILNRTMLYRAETGSSDAHIVEAIGHGYTLYEGGGMSDLKKALNHHQTQAIFTGWSFLGLLKYAWFFLPRGIRLLWFSFFIRFHPKTKRLPAPTALSLTKY